MQTDLWKLYVNSCIFEFLTPCSKIKLLHMRKNVIVFLFGDSLVLHCAFLLRTIFASLARANERARVQNVRDFPQTKFDSEINARFLLNEHGDPHFLFYKFNENIVLNNWEKNWQKSMATFLANEINATDRDVMGPTEEVQIMFPLKDKNIN